MPSRRYPLRLWITQDLDSGGVLTSGAIDCRTSDPDFLMFRITQASGAADAKIRFLISDDGMTFNTSSSQPDIVTSTNTDYASNNPEDYHVLNCPAAPWIKIEVTEVATLDNNVVDATLWMRE